MKSSAYIVNAGRGGLIEDADLIAALEAGKISGAALYVFTTEPLAEDSPYWELPNVLVTPHRAGYFLGSGEALAQIAVANQIGRVHGLTPAPNAHLVCRLLLENTNHAHP